MSLPTTSSCAESHCLCEIASMHPVTVIQDCPEHGVNGYHPDVVIWGCHDPELTT